MNAPARLFEFQPAVRSRVSLLIAIAGASGSGKTRSALGIARGLAGGDDSKIAVIDTEAGRALHYAPAMGEKATADRFAFSHGDLRAPFSPEAYADAISAADAAGFEVIVIDSCSHEYEGDGGLHDMHDDLVASAVEKARKSATEKGWNFDEARASDTASVGAWKDPKKLHKRFVSRLLQCRAHLILCLRADEKIRIEKVKDDRSRERTVIVQPKDMPPNERWVPICEKRFMYEMTLSFILTPQRPGFPIPIKLQAQHRAAVPLDQQLSESTGRALAAWARGTNPPPPLPTVVAPPAPSDVPTDEGAAGETGGMSLEDEAREAASRGSDVFKKLWKRLTVAQRNSLARIGDELGALKRAADEAAVDAEFETEVAP